MSFETIISDTEIEQMKTKLRTLQRKRDNLAINVAITLNLPSVWTLDMVDWNNPEVAGIKPQIDSLEKEINELSLELDYQESIKEDNMNFYNAKIQANKFVDENFNNFDDEIAFYKKNGLIRGMSSLIDMILKNPSYLDEVVL